MRMNKLFIEAKNNKTPEYYFLKTLLCKFFPDKVVEFIFMAGVGNLFREPILNQIRIAQTSGEGVLVFVDADITERGYGYQKRKKDIEHKARVNNISFPYFLYPNNRNDGTVENLMEEIARRDLHPVFFDCFEDYEKCISGQSDADGNPIYQIPNLKGKLHTFINAQRLSNVQRRELGAGNWLFEDKQFWDIDSEALQPLKNLLQQNLQ